MRCQRVFQLCHAALSHCYCSNNGNTEFAGDNRRINRQPVPFGHIDHIQRDDGGQAKRNQFNRKAQMIFKVARINHDDKRIRAALTRLHAHHYITCYLFVRTRRIKAVCAGKIDQLNGPAIRKRQSPRMALNGHAGIISRLLSRASKRIE
jgi:hypothetical protein